MNRLDSMDVKWYSKYVFLVGAILSFADPITDILTLVEFYLSDHKTWFAVGLGFVILPWVPFGFFFVILKRPFISPSSSRGRLIPSCKWLSSFLIAFNPFSAAAARLKMFVTCIKNEYVQPTGDLLYSRASAFFEAVLESGPQFVIQLYVMSVQDEPVSIIQMISLPVSLLSLVWTLTSGEELWNRAVITDNIHVKHKVLIFFTYSLLLSSRLFAVGYFTVSYKWWIISVLMFHSILMVIVGYICSFRQHGEVLNVTFTFQNAVKVFVKFCVQWITDDTPFFTLQNKNTIRWFSNVLFMAENLVMILLFYFSGHSNTWYALPVTVCVCSFTVLGAIMRITHFYFLQKGKQVIQNVPVDPQLEKNIIPTTTFQNFYYCYETAV